MTSFIKLSNASLSDPADELAANVPITLSTGDITNIVTVEYAIILIVCAKGPPPNGGIFGV
jgi:hypothetical protein